jgi:hypothetical protein
VERLVEGLAQRQPWIPPAHHQDRLTRRFPKPYPVRGRWHEREGDQEYRYGDGAASADGRALVSNAGVRAAVAGPYVVRVMRTGRWAAAGPLREGLKTVMSEHDADLGTELGRLRRCRGRERNDLVWRLARRGQAIVPQLQHIRRHGPGRLRAAALEILVNIVGEAGLHPTDVAAAERLVRIKAPLEPFLNVNLCWDAWMCVRGGDQRGIMGAAGLTPVRPATFALATRVVSDRLDDPDGLVFVTPELNGWTVVAGRWCDPSHDERGEEVRLLVEKLSSRYGEAHAYFITEYSEDSTWLVARDGQTVRRYSEESAALAMGRPLPIERRHLDAMGISGSPEQMHGDEEMDEVFLEFSGTCTARTVAAEMSVDIVAGLHRNDSLVRGTGMLARIPGTSTTCISPGPYEI